MPWEGIYHDTTCFITTFCGHVHQETTAACWQCRLANVNMSMGNGSRCWGKGGQACQGASAASAAAAQVWVIGASGHRRYRGTICGHLALRSVASQHLQMRSQHRCYDGTMLWPQDSCMLPSRSGNDQRNSHACGLGTTSTLQCMGCMQKVQVYACALHVPVLGGASPQPHALPKPDTAPETAPPHTINIAMPYHIILTPTYIIRGSTNQTVRSVRSLDVSSSSSRFLSGGCCVTAISRTWGMSVSSSAQRSTRARQRSQ